MKNAFKLSFVVFVISLSISACSSDKKAMGTSDSTKVDSAASSTTTTDTTTKKDTTRKT